MTTHLFQLAERQDGAGHDAPRAKIFTAVVIEDNAEQVTLEDHGLRFQARPAVSCLVAPQKGDRVAVMDDGCCGYYILHVLERDCSDVAIEVRGALRMRAGKGISLAARQSVDLAAAAGCTLSGKTIGMVAEEASVCVRKLRASGHELLSNYAKVNVIARWLGTVADTVMQQARNSVRNIEMLDKQQAGESITHVRKLFSLRAKQAMLTAEQDVKVDGERIHMG